MVGHDDMVGIFKLSLFYYKKPQNYWSATGKKKKVSQIHSKINVHVIDVVIIWNYMEPGILPIDLKILRCECSFLGHHVHDGDG